MEDLFVFCFKCYSLFLFAHVTMADTRNLFSMLRYALICLLIAEVFILYFNIFPPNSQFSSLISTRSILWLSVSFQGIGKKHNWLTFRVFHGTCSLDLVHPVETYPYLSGRNFVSFQKFIRKYCRQWHAVQIGKAYLFCLIILPVRFLE